MSVALACVSETVNSPLIGPLSLPFRVVPIDTVAVSLSVIVPVPVSVSVTSGFTASRLTVNVSLPSTSASLSVTTVNCFVSPAVPVKFSAATALLKSSGETSGAAPPVAVTSLSVTLTDVPPCTALFNVIVNSRPTPSTTVTSLTITAALSLSVIVPVAALVPRVICGSPVIRPSVTMTVSLASSRRSLVVGTVIVAVVLPAGIVTLVVVLVKSFAAPGVAVLPLKL